MKIQKIDFLKNESVLVEIIRRWSLLFLIIQIIYFSIMKSAFFSVNVAQMILFFGVSVFLLGTAELFVIITGGIDLSVGYIFGFASIVSSKIIVYCANAGLSPLLSILTGVVLTMLIGILPGLGNGYLVAKLKVPPFIATFSMLGITHGLSELLLEGIPAKNLPIMAGNFGSGHFIYIVPNKTVSFFSKPIVERGVKVVELIPNVVVLTIVILLICAFLLHKTKFGRHIFAIGGNMDAAVRSGIRVDRQLIKVYILSSLLATSAGIIYMFQYITGKADGGASFLLDSIAAVVIGGASLSGGSGSVGKTIIGALVIAVLETGLRMMSVPTFDKYIIVGVVLIVAVLIDQIVPEKSYKEDVK